MANTKETTDHLAVPSALDRHEGSLITDAAARSNRWSLSRVKNKLADKLHVPRSKKRGSRSPSPAPFSMGVSATAPGSVSSLSVNAPNSTTTVSTAATFTSETSANISISGTSTVATHSSGTSQNIPIVATPTEPARTRPRADIFSVNGTRTEIVAPIPKGDDLLIEDTVQLVLCVGLLPSDHYGASPTPPLLGSNMDSDNVQQQWIQHMVDNPLERKHLYNLMNRIVDNFITTPTKDSDSIREVILVGPLLDKEHFRLLVMFFLDEFEKSALLHIDILLGLVQLVQDAPAKSLKQDDLTRILQSVRNRLEDSNQKDTEDRTHLALAVTILISVLASYPVTSLHREKEHEPLLKIISQLQKHLDPLVRFQAEYASQIFLAVQHDETKRHEFGRHIIGLTGGLLTMSNVIKLEFDGIMEGAPDVIEGAVGLFKLAKKVFGADAPERWFHDVLEAEMYAWGGQFLNLNKLICNGLSHADIKFQWRACQLLGEIAAGPMWDETSRCQSLALLVEYCKVNDYPNRHSEIRRWVLTILRHISELAFTHFPAGTLHSQELSNERIKVKAQKLLQDLRRNSDNGLQSSYPLRNRLPLPRSSTLLMMANKNCDLDFLIDRLRRQRWKEYGRWTKYANMAIYIEPMSKPNLKPSDDIKPLKARAQSFIAGKAKVLLILGDSGSGKSTFNRRLEFELWEKYKTWAPIPLFIDLKTITNEKDMIKEHLERLNLFSGQQISELRNTRQFILICDGYDEHRSRSNLYVTNMINQPNQWKASMVISCRSQYLGSDYRGFFAPHANDIYNYRQLNISELFEEVAIVPFRPREIRQYVDQYIASQETTNPAGRDADWYMEAMNKVPKLNDLVTNPFLLRLMLDTLPRIVGSSSDLSQIQVNRVKLYDEYVIQHFQLESRRLASQTLEGIEKVTFKAIHGEFLHAGIDYLKRLAAEIFTKLGGINSIEYSVVDAEPWMEEFFSEENTRARLLRESSPLVITGGQYRFFHRSILEYFFSCRVFEPKRSSTDSDYSGDDQFYPELSKFLDPVGIRFIANHPFGVVNLISDPSILHFLVERVAQSESFKQQLIQIVKLSKDKPDVGRAAANAITILVRSGVRFNGVDFQGIQIPGADLSEGYFDSAQLQGADLSNVCLKRTWLRQADLTGATMTNVWFGEKPFFKIPQFFSSEISRDGTILAVGLDSGEVQIYHVSDLRLRQTFKHSGAVEYMAFSNDGCLIALVGWDQTVRIWNLNGGEGWKFDGRSDQVCRVAFAPNGRYVAFTSMDGTARIWEFESKSCVCTFIIVGTSLAWSPCGCRIVTVNGSISGGLTLWNVETGECERTFDLDTVFVNSIVYSCNGKLLVVGLDAKIFIWDLASDNEYNKPLIIRGTSSFMSATFSEDELTVAVVCQDHSIQLWDVLSGSLIDSLNGHSSSVTSVAFLKDQELVSASQDGTVRFWQLKDEMDLKGNSFNSSKSGNQDLYWVRSLAYSPKDDFIFTSSEDGWIRQWNARNGDCRRFLEVQAETITISPSGRHLVTANGDLKVYQLSNIDEPKVNRHFGSRAGVVAYSPCERWMASGDDKGIVRLWDLRSREDARILEGHPHGIGRLKFSPDGCWLVSLSIGCTIRLWDTESAVCSEVLELKGYDASFSPCGMMLACLDFPCVRVRHIQEQRVANLVGLEVEAICMAWSPCGSWIVVGCCNETTLIWKISNKGQELVGSDVMVVRGFQGPVYCLAWSPATPLEFATGSRGSICVWRIVEVKGEAGIQLVWNSMPSRLTTFGAKLSQVIGLTEMQQNLLMQRRAIDNAQDSSRSMK